VSEWRLSPEEAAYVERQQGFHCISCGSNLRSMVLAKSILDFYGAREPFADFIRDADRDLAILEINEAGNLSQFLRLSRGHHLVEFPDVDMTSLPFATASFDLVVHSDTLEHVPHPIAGLAECRRVLRKGSACAFTVPIIVGRLTSSRAGLPPSYHLGGPEKDPRTLVHTEYGADAWTHVIRAGFQQCRITAIDFPAAHCLLGVA